MQVLLFTDVADTVGYGKYAGTYKVATEIRKAGYTCQVIDLFSKYSYDELEKIINKFVTSYTILIGFSCTLMEKRVGVYGAPNSKVYNFGRPDSEVQNLLAYAKGKNNKLKIVIGGARINFNTSFPFVDYSITNKADIAIIRLIEHLLYGTNLPVVKTNPIIVIDGNSEEYFYNQEDFATSKIIYEQNDIILPNEVLPIEIARGCIFSCAFCHFDLIGKKIGEWQKTKQSLYDEIMRNYEIFGTTEYMISDELLNESLPKMELIYEVFQSLPFQIGYTSYARLDLIHAYPQMREIILDSGALSITFGIETMSEIAGKKISKGLGPERIKKTLNYVNETWRGKIITSSNFIVGLPGETEQSLRDTVDWLVGPENPLDIFGFTTLFVRPSSDGRAESKIDKDPTKFKMKIVNDYVWEGEHMDFNRAVHLTQEFSNDPRVTQKVKFGAATWMGRVVNCGLSIAEIYKLIHNTNISRNMLTKIINYKAKQVEKKYLTKLLEV